VHWNPVKHRLVARPGDYGFSSYAQHYTAAPDQVQRSEQQFGWEHVDDVPDDFDD
jgi:hypothetical protein